MVPWQGDWHCPTERLNRYQDQRFSSLSGPCCYSNNTHCVCQGQIVGDSNSRGYDSRGLCMCPQSFSSLWCGLLHSLPVPFFISVELCLNPHFQPLDHGLTFHLISVHRSFALKELWLWQLQQQLLLTIVVHYLFNIDFQSTLGTFNLCYRLFNLQPFYKLHTCMHVYRHVSCVLCDMRVNISDSGLDVRTCIYSSW